MSKTEMEELGKRAVACKHWRWMPGMLDAYGDRVLSVVVGKAGAEVTTDYLEWTGIAYMQTQQHGTWADDERRHARPDLSDPATLGCLLALVREAWGDVKYSEPMGGWYVFNKRFVGARYDTEAEALVAALEAAP